VARETASKLAEDSERQPETAMLQDVKERCTSYKKKEIERPAERRDMRGAADVVHPNPVSGVAAEGQP
jgi:hypothetical protein